MGYNGSRSPQLSQVNVKPLKLADRSISPKHHQQFDTSFVPRSFLFVFFFLINKTVIVRCIYHTAILVQATFSSPI